MILARDRVAQRTERRRIAMQPGVESLNAATAAAVALYVWSRHRAGGTLSGHSPDPAASAD